MKSKRTVVDVDRGDDNRGNVWRKLGQGYRYKTMRIKIEIENEGR